MEKKYPNIMVRLIFGFAFLILLLAISLLYLSRSFYGINQVVHELTEHPYTVSNSLKDIGLQLGDMYRKMSFLVGYENKEQFDHTVLEIRKLENQVESKYQIVSDRYLGDQQSVKQAINRYEDSKQIRNKVIGLLTQGNKSEAISIINSEGFPLLQELFKKNQILLDYADNKAIEFNNQSEQIISQTTKDFYIYLISTLLIALLIAYWIFVSINKPLKKIVQHIQQDGEKVKPGNIIQALDNAVDELNTYKNHLMDMVKERTNEVELAKQKIEMAIENAPIGITMVRMDGKFLQANQAFCEIIGYTLDELKELTFTDITYPDDMNIGAEFIKRIVNDEIKKGEFEKRYVHKDGSVITTWVTSSLVWDNEGQPEFFFSQIMDITQKKKQEIELEKYRNHLEDLVQERAEELATLNEELAATNEELETTNEELAAINEELESTNEQLVASNQELDRFNQLFVGREFRIKELKDKVKELEEKMRNS
ncbi:MAG: PAS domain S-box protein [Bacteroidales bacterium]|nr:PAS domain S-box protein [Bacteroidales bacterium]MCF8455193.1 PAS domain S-box protein [Bacteroidales bacterium]